MNAPDETYVWCVVVMARRGHSNVSSTKLKSVARYYSSGTMLESKLALSLFASKVYLVLLVFLKISRF